MNTAAVSDRRPNRLFISQLARLLFGVATLVSLIASYAWSGDQGWWGPGTSAILAWGLFALHLAICGRYLSALDPGLWVPVNMLLYYFSMPIVVAMQPVYVNYDVWHLSGGVPPQLDRGFVVALLTLVAFLLGFHIAGLRNFNLRIQTRNADGSLFFPGLVLTYGGLGMIFLGVVVVGPSIIFGAYGEMARAANIGGFDPRIVMGGGLFAAGGSLALLAAYDGSRHSLVVAAVGAAGVCAFMLGTGDRGGLSAFAFAAGWVFTVQIRRISKWTAVLPFVGAMLLMPMIKEYRDYKTTEESQQMSVSELSLAILSEMGGAFQTFCYTIEHVPRDKGYDYGLSYVQAGLHTVPNFGLKSGTKFLLDPLKHDPSRWMVWRISPEKHAFGGGYGHAIGAEWYFNFGIPGVCLGMIAVGYLTARFRNAAGRGGMMLVWCALYYQMLILLVRNSMGMPLKLAIWPLVGILVFRGAFSTLGMRLPPPRSDASSPAQGPHDSDHPALPTAPPSR